MAYNSVVNTESVEGILGVAAEQQESVADATDSPNFEPSV